MAMVKRWFGEWWPLLVAAFVAACLFVVVDRIAGSFWPSDSVGVADDCSAFCVSDEESVRASLGALGDVVGGLLNPFLTFLTIFLLIRTLKQSQESLKLTSETLDKVEVQNDLIRDEMSRNTVELEKAANAQESMMETQKVQQVTYAFFEHYRLYIEQRNRACLERKYGVMAVSLAEELVERLLGDCVQDGRLQQAINELDEADLFEYEFVAVFVSAFRLAEGDERLLGVLRGSLTPELKILLILFCEHSVRTPSIPLDWILMDCEGSEGFLAGDLVRIDGYYNFDVVRKAATKCGVVVPGFG